MKRALSLILASLMLVAMLAGCAPAETDKPTTPTTPVEPNKPTDPNKPAEPTKPSAGLDPASVTRASTHPLSEIEAVPAGARTELVVGESADVVNPFPQKSNDTSSSRVNRMMYNSLLWMDTSAKLQPALAEKWEVLEDGLTYKFTIRKGVKFHNGDELTAADVKYTLDMAKTAPNVKQFVEAVKEVKVDSDYEITLTTLYPYAPMLGNLSGTQLSIINKKYHETVGDDGYRDKPIGTGPMKFVSWTPNDKFVVERNDDYWGTKATTTKITIRVIPEETSRTIALENGEVDFLGSVPAVDIKRVLGNTTTIKTHEQTSTSVSYLSFNQSKAPFDNVKVRQALNYACNKEAIIDVICEGYGIPINTTTHTTMPGYVADLNLYPYDVEKAKALMAEAGYADGFKAEVACNAGIRDRIAQLLQADFGAIGVKVDVNVMEWGAYLEYTSGKDHDMYILGWSASYEPDTTFNPLFHTDSGGATGNRGWYSNKKVDDLIMKGRTTIDMEDRKPIYAEIQKILMEDAVWLPLYSAKTVIAMNKNLVGIDISPVDSHTWIYSYILK